MIAARPLRSLDRRVRLRRARNIARILGEHLSPGQWVLDVGAGDGLVASQLQRRRAVRVVAVEIQRSNPCAVPMVLYDGLHLPFRDRTFDAVLLVYVLHHCSQARRVLEEAKRVCRGRLLVMEDAYDGRWERLLVRAFHRYLTVAFGMPGAVGLRDPRGWARLFEEMGLAVVEQHALGRDDPLFPLRHVLFLLEPR